MSDGLPAWPREGVGARRASGVRPGIASDWLRVSWLIETSRRVYTHWGSESLRDLLAARGALIWQQGRALRGVFLASTRRGVVGDARLLTVHDDADLAQFGDEVLSAAERRLNAFGSRWLSYSSPDDWLRALLTPRGYALKDRVITYARRGTALDAHVGAAAVRHALPEHVPGMAAVDAAAFEPFWRLDRESLRRALDQDSYVLVAVEGGAEVGYLVADVWEERAHVVRLGVAPERQGRGIATRLIAEALRLMGEAGVREVMLNTQETNARSRALYEKLGFAPTGGVEEVWAKELEPERGED